MTEMDLQLLSESSSLVVTVTLTCEFSSWLAGDSQVCVRVVEMSGGQVFTETC